mgnify:FL=1
MGVLAMTHFCNHDTRPADGPAERTLEQLWVDFVKLQRLRSEVLSDLCTGETKDVSPDLIEGILTPIASELRQLATRAATVGSSSQDDIEYKAVILAEFLRDDDSALRTRLAGSLVSDIRSGACLAAT